MLKQKHGEIIRSVSINKADWDRAKEIGDRFIPRITRQQTIRLAILKGLNQIARNIKE